MDNMHCVDQYSRNLSLIVGTEFLKRQHLVIEIQPRICCLNFVSPFLKVEL